jgi:eukaryotic-like serine/threonine-protein kinase
VLTQPALDRIAHFRIVGKVGAGGMGIVFRAHDERLGRTVAVKVLPPAFTADADRRARFMREARTAATVVHPNIAVIYEVGEDGGMVYIAMEWVDGRTLRETLAGQAMSLSEALDVGLEIARGVSCAHDAGIVHRDLKPDNIMIGRGGQVKILDFGLAKLLSVSSGDPMNPTQPQLTQGVPPMGTPRYMSPEQARGVEVDQRSDLFSFGATLYEMVGGRSPFQGDTDMDLVVAVISMRPAPLSVPPELARVIDRCLEKEPHRRYQSCAELIEDLEACRRSLQTTSSLAPPPVERSAVRPLPRSPRRVAVVAGAAAAIAVSAVALYQRFDRAQPPVPVIGPAKVERLTSHSVETNIWTGSLSPDGRYLAYITERGVSRVLSVASGDEVPLALPKGGVDIDWAVDSAHVFVTTEGQKFTSIWVAPIAPNQSAIKLLDKGHFPQAAPDGKRFAYIGPGGLTVRDISTAEGQRSIVPLPASAFDGLAWSPHGKRIAFVTSDGKDDSSIKLETVSVEGGAPQRVPEATNLYAIRGCIAWLADGRIVYAGKAPGGALRSVWVDENTGEAGGPSVALIAEDFPAQELSPTSDGKRLAFKRVDTQSDAYVAALDREPVAPRRLTLQDDDDRPLQWTNDSREVLFEARRRGTFAIFRQQRETAEPTRVRAVAAVESLRLTPDGKAFFGVRKTAGGWNLLRLPLGPGEETVLRKLEGPAEPSVRCARAPATACFLGRHDEEQVRLQRLDERGQVSGPTIELPGFFRSRSWDLSPAGDRVAAILEDHMITVVRLADKATQELAGGPACPPEDVAWEPSGNSVIVTCDGKRLEHRLYRVDLDGRVRLLWSTSPSALELPSVSPDGRWVTLRVWTYDPDFWLLSAF